jgi:hypothetical protein
LYWAGNYADTDPANTAQHGACLRTPCPKAFATTSQRLPGGGRRIANLPQPLDLIEGNPNIEILPPKRYGHGDPARGHKNLMVDSVQNIYTFQGLLLQGSCLPPFMFLPEKPGRY